MHQYIEAYHKHRIAAESALVLFRSYCTAPMPRVPGMNTVIRLAWRIACGRSIEESAAREYIYRWSLAILAGDQITCGSRVRNNAVSIFGAPHTIGM